MKKNIYKALAGSVVMLLSGVALAASNLCQGQLVYGNNGNHLVGTVQNLFGSKAEVRWLTLNGQTYYGNSAYWEQSDLSEEVSCAREGICKGTVVYGHNGNHLVGTVRHVFRNGQTEIAWSLMNGQTYYGTLAYWGATELARQIDCSRGICSGDQVYGNNGNNLVGAVTRVFANGQAEVRWSQMNGSTYYGNLAYWPVTDLEKQSGRCGGRRCH